MKFPLFLSAMLLLLPAICLFAQTPALTVHNYDKRADTLKKSKYTLAQFEGRWQEMGRVKSGNNEWVKVTDTFYIRFYDNGKADTKQGNSLVITGAAAIDRKDNITTSANDFKIISVLPDKILLDDNMGYLHSLSRVDIFAYEIKTSPPAVVVDTTKAVIDLTPASLIKSWFAYRREASPGFINSATALLRNLKIEEQQHDNSYKGEVEFAQAGKAFVQACTLTFSGNNLQIVAADNTWNVEVYKANGQEMIMGRKGELVYYFKNGN